MRYEVSIHGLGSILMHNGILADPLSAESKALKAVTKKRSKTDDNHEEVAEIEWRGSLYWCEEMGPYLPADCIHASLLKGAKRHKLGVQLNESLAIDEERIALCVKDLPAKVAKDRTALYRHDSGRFIDRRGVRVGTARVSRTRPKFSGWSAKFTIDCDIEIELMEEVVASAGKAGIGDFRPRFGRYRAEIRAIK